MSEVTVPNAFALAVQHHQAGRLPEAESLYRQILAAQPSHPGATHLLGVIAHQGGRHDVAIELIRKSLVLQPTDAAAHCNLGEALRATGRLDEAIAAFRSAFERNAHMPVAHNNLGIVFAEQGRLDDAVAAYHQALQLAPDYAEAHNNLGIALKEQGRHEPATASFRRALELKPHYAEAHNNLGLALAELDRFDEAAAAYRRALELRPDYAEAQSNLGNVFRAQGQLDDAVAAYERSLATKPDSAETQNNLGSALKDQGRLDEAIASYRLALQYRPGHAKARSNLILALHLHPEQDRRVIVEEQRLWNEQCGRLPGGAPLPHPVDRRPERRLRVGYVSPDFRDHVVGRNILPLIRNHHHEEFEILCYSGVIKPDQMTEEFRRLADGWRGTVGLSDEKLAAAIREEGVDILVDLSQHTAGNRLSMFAHRPAPVQVSFAGYPESAGVEGIGYRISDRWVEGQTMQDTSRKSQDESERSAQPESCNMHPASGIYLLDSFWCYDPCGLEIAVGELPAEKSGCLTFASLNNFCKINEPVLRLWARILGAVKNSRLILLSGFGSHRERTLEFLARNGVERHRVEFLPMQFRHAYLETYRQLDIVLDPFPYNGHTTSLDALWMGVPVVSLAGRPAVSRAGFSQMSNLDLPELVAFSAEEYVRIAVELALDHPRLRELRAALRPRMEASVLMDGPRFCRQIEDAFRSMWRRWCAENS